MGKRVTIKVDKSTIQRWHEAGYTYQQMADEHMEMFDEAPTRAAFQAYCKREGIGKPRALRPGSELIPWTVKPEHKNAHVYDMLCSLARIREGMPLSERRLRQAENFKQSLIGAGVVIAYDPATGFKRVPKLDTDSELVRPTVN